MNESTLVTVLTGIFLVAISCLLTYLFMAGLACFSTWTNDYWNISSWEAPYRGILFLFWAFWLGRGIWATVATILEDMQ